MRTATPLGEVRTLEMDAGEHALVDEASQPHDGSPHVRQRRRRHRGHDGRGPSLEVEAGRCARLVDGARSEVETEGTVAVEIDEPGEHPRRRDDSALTVVVDDHGIPDADPAAARGDTGVDDETAHTGSKAAGARARRV